MVLRLQRSPLALHIVVGLHLHLTLAPLISILLIPWNEVGKHQGIGTLGTVFGENTHQKEINTLGLLIFQGTKHMPPTKGEETTIAALLESMRERGNGNTHSNNLLVSVPDAALKTPPRK